MTRSREQPADLLRPPTALVTDAPMPRIFLVTGAPVIFRANLSGSLGRTREVLAYRGRSHDVRETGFGSVILLFVTDQWTTPYGDVPPTQDQPPQWPSYPATPADLGQVAEPILERDGRRLVRARHPA
jgi:hypothetical protein